jgi:hypothetical protein
MEFKDNTNEPAPLADEPPTYDNAMETEAAEIEAAWDRKRPEMWQRWINMTIRYEPVCRQSLTMKRIFRNRRTHPSWCATLKVKAKNISRLLHRGFDWTWVNVAQMDMDQARLERCKPARGLKKVIIPWKHMRAYRLKGVGPHAGWTAVLSVRSIRLDVVLNFNVEQLTKDTVCAIFAFDWDKTLAYHACRRDWPYIQFNDISKQMPRSDWWLKPQPAKPGQVKFPGRKSGGSTETSASRVRNDNRTPRERETVLRGEQGGGEHRVFGQMDWLTSRDREIPHDEDPMFNPWIEE